MTHDCYSMKRERNANSKEPHLSSILASMATPRADDPGPTRGGIRRWEGHSRTRRGKQACQCAHSGTYRQSAEYHPKAVGIDAPRRRPIGARSYITSAQRILEPQRKREACPVMPSKDPVFSKRSSNAPRSAASIASLVTTATAFLSAPAAAKV